MLTLFIYFESVSSSFMVCEGVKRIKSCMLRDVEPLPLIFLFLKKVDNSRNHQRSRGNYRVVLRRFVEHVLDCRLALIDFFFR